MPKELFSKPAPETLVNQSVVDDDVPFEAQTGDAGAGAPLGNQVPEPGEPKQESPAKIHLLEDKLKAMAEELNNSFVINNELRKEAEASKEQLDQAASIIANQKETATEVESMKSDLSFTQDALQRAKLLNEELQASVAHLKQLKSTPTPLGETFAQKCFLAVLNGMATNGDFTVGSKLNSDTHIASAAKHAAGVASFFAQAAKDARL